MSGLTSPSPTTALTCASTSTGNWLTTAVPDGAEPSSGDLKIGCSEEFEDNFKGLIDEVRIYDRALSAGEVKPDITPPSIPTEISATLEEEEAYVTWRPSTDPSFPNGDPGSGIKGYTVQYKKPEGEWSPPQVVDTASIELEGKKENEAITLKIRAVDNEGNASPSQIDVVTITEPLWDVEDVGGERPGEVNEVPRMPPEPVHFPGETAEPAPFAAQTQSFHEELCSNEPGPCGVYFGRNAAQYAEEWNLLPASGPEEEQEEHDEHYGILRWYSRWRLHEFR